MLDQIFGGNNSRTKSFGSERAPTMTEEIWQHSRHDLLLHGPAEGIHLERPAHALHAGLHRRRVESASFGTILQGGEYARPAEQNGRVRLHGNARTMETNHDGLMELWNASQTEVPGSHGESSSARTESRRNAAAYFSRRDAWCPLQSWWDDINHFVAVRVNVSAIQHKSRSLCLSESSEPAATRTALCSMLFAAAARRWWWRRISSASGSAWTSRRRPAA